MNSPAWNLHVHNLTLLNVGQFKLDQMMISSGRCSKFVYLTVLISIVFIVIATKGYF